MSFKVVAGTLALAALVFAGCRSAESPDEAAGMTVKAGEYQPDGTRVVSAKVDFLALPFENQNGAAVRLSDFDGKPTLVNFIYTRCPIPNMCPATTMNVAGVQRALTPSEREKVKIVSVTFDPEYDTPNVLTEYGNAYGADFTCWEFWRGEESDAEALMDSFNAWAQDTGDEYAHNMRSVILGPDGSVAEVLKGSAWDTDAAAATLRRLAGADSGA